MPLTRRDICRRMALEFQDGWIVNLGAGLPTLCANERLAERTVFFHSENGVIGCGPLAAPGKADPHLINAANEYITLIPGAAIVHHADSFALVRGGRLSATVLGAYEVSADGDLANWKMEGRRGGAIGGAMDLAVGARRLFVVMEHATKKGAPRMKLRCELPPTARGVVKLIVTNLGVFEPRGDRYLMREIAPGYGPDEVRALTAAPIELAPDLKNMTVTA